jgi:hypothetical protein
VVAALLLGALTSLMLLGGAQGTGYRDTGYWLLFFSVPGPLVYNSAPPTFGHYCGQHRACLPRPLHFAGL